MAADSQLASPRRIQAALSTATESFAAELAAPGTSMPRWSAFEWTMAKAAAVLHGVTPLLASRLQWIGPDLWTDFATGQFQHVRARHQRIEMLLTRLHDASAAKQIGFIALKGAALHALGIYLPGQRPMADIDLLVPLADAPGLSGVLQSLGYGETAVSWKHRVFAPCPPPRESRALPFGEHRDASIKIELHTAVAEQLPVRMRDITALVLRQPLAPGRNPYPSDAALLLHLLLHAAGSIVTQNLRLIQLYDLASLARGLAAAGWGTIADAPAWALPPLQLTALYFPGCVPMEVLAALRRRSAWRLDRIARTRRLCDLSYARVQANPLPGLVWSASAGEAIEYIWRRVRPNAEQRCVFDLMRCEAWARHSDLQLSRPRRIVRRLLLSPPRAATMYVVKAALAAARSDYRGEAVAVAATECAVCMQSLPGRMTSSAAQTLTE